MLRKPFRPRLSAMWARAGGSRVKIERIEIFVTTLAARVQRIFSSGSYDTGPAERVLGKPVLVKIHAEGVIGCAQIRPISPGHFVADTTQSAVAAIREIYGPALLGKSIFDIAAAQEAFDLRLAGNPAARAVLDIALYDAIGKQITNLPLSAEAVYEAIKSLRHASKTT